MTDPEISMAEQDFLESVSDWLGADMLHYSDSEVRANLAKVERKCPGIRLSAITHLIRTRSLPAEISGVIVEIFVNHETYFFRNRIHRKNELCFALKYLSPRCGKVNILSAGCSFGEEIFSLLMDADSSGLLPNFGKIAAVDVSAMAIATARMGVYGDWSMRACPGWMQLKYFRRLPLGQWQISPSIAELVEFSCVNLCDSMDQFFVDGKKWNLIVSKNVVLHLSPVSQAKLINNLVGVLAPGGVIIFAGSEQALVEKTNILRLKNRTLNIFCSTSEADISRPETFAMPDNQNNRLAVCR